MRWPKATGSLRFVPSYAHCGDLLVVAPDSTVGQISGTSNVITSFPIAPLTKSRQLCPDVGSVPHTPGSGAQPRLQKPGFRA